jgi:hypothetical protein
MADVFVSYKSDDRLLVQRLVSGLRALGCSVWWDQDIAPGAPWELTIEQELKGAKAAVVAWSPVAVASENVKSEARWALRERRLVQVFVAPCDPPLFFGERQGVSLHGWGGDTADPRFQTVFEAVRAVVDGRPASRGAIHTRRVSRWRVWLLAIGAATSVAVVAAVALGLGRTPAQPHKAAPAAADRVAAPAQTREGLIQSVVGAWDRQDGNCATPIRITTTPGLAGDTTTITVTGPRGFNSTGQIIAAEAGKIVSRDIGAAGSASGETWEYRPDGALMTVISGKGVPTSLKRCAAA